MSKHRWYDVIVAWAEGKEIQFKYNGDEWQDYTSGYYGNPGFNSLDLEWRIKPKTVIKRYRMALVSTPVISTKFSHACITEVIAVDITDSCIDDPAEYNVKGFIRWLGEPVEVEFEEKNDENE